MFSWVIWGFLLFDFRVIAIPQSQTLELESNYDDQFDDSQSLNEKSSSILSPGFVGCLFSDVCSPSERCVNDNLFGRCQSEEEFLESKISGEIYAYDELFLEYLEAVLQTLWQSQLTWQDLRTQCIVKTALLSQKVGEPLEFSACFPQRRIPKRSEEPIFVHKYTVLDSIDNDLVGDVEDAETNDVTEDELPIDDSTDTKTEPGKVSVEEDELEKELNERLRKLNHKTEGEMLIPDHHESLQIPDKRLFADGFHPRQTKDRNLDRMCIVLKFSSKDNLDEEQAKKIFLILNEQIPADEKLDYFQVDNSSNELFFYVPYYSSVSSEVIVNQLRNGSIKINGFTLETVSSGSPKCRSTIDGLTPPRGQVLLTVILCASVLSAVVVILLLFTIHRHRRKMAKSWETNFSSGFVTSPENKAGVKGIQPVFYGPGAAGQASAEQYKDLCRQRLFSKSVDETTQAFVDGNKRKGSGGSYSGSPRNSSAFSWGDDLIQSNMDISTGHAILSYMEEHLNAKDKLEAEWQTLCIYEADNSQALVAKDEKNIHKNRYIDALPYDHSRVKLLEEAADGSDFINASFIVDHDPKVPSYIVTQGPLNNTVPDFWQMVWEQGSVTIVNLCCLIEGGVPMCHKYWPEEGPQIHGSLEINLVSEHAWSSDYVVRSFYMKNLSTGETRTVTQFHFITWPDLDVPNSPKAILEFRRKVNKSFRNKSSPVIIHCNDGCGRSGTYVLLDMILNRLNKGVKEVDVAATLEHIRDQRMDMVKTKEQFEFVLTCIAEEVETLLKVMAS